MTTEADAAGREVLSDTPERWEVAASGVVHRTGRVIAIRRDEVRPPDGSEGFVRDVVEHPGAVGIIALDEHGRVLVVRQYRHPVGHRLVEPPAGLLDVAGEDYLAGAQRELYEEGHVTAADWRVLCEFFTSPGMTTEATRIYLARGLSHVAHSDRYVGHHEEADMVVDWVPLAALVTGVLSGQLHNPVLCVGVLAAWAASTEGGGAGHDSLRPGDAPWPAREAIPR